MKKLFYFFLMLIGMTSIAAGQDKPVITITNEPVGCYNEAGSNYTVLLEYNLSVMSADKYIIRFDDPALADIEQDQPLSMGTGTIEISLPGAVNPGVYDAEIEVVKSLGGTEESSSDPYDFAIEIYPPFNAGEIASEGEEICAEAAPAMINSAEDASGGDGDISYQWRKEGEEDPISGANTPGFLPVEAGTYIRYAKDNTCSDWAPSEGSWTLNRLPGFEPGAIKTGTNIVCTTEGGDPVPIPNITEAAGGDGNISYRWKINGTLIEEAAGSSYTPVASVPGTYVYIREAKDGTCSDWIPSDGLWTLNILSGFDPGAIETGIDTVCTTEGGDPVPIPNITEAAGGDGNISYRWRKNGRLIEGAAGSNYTPVESGPGIYVYIREAKDGECSDWISSAGEWTLIIEAERLDVPEKPQGDSVICRFTEQSVYRTTSVSGASAYTWKLLPEAAGKVMGNGYEVSILWDWSAEAWVWDSTGKYVVKLYISAGNTCAESLDSDTLFITVRRTPEVEFIQPSGLACANQQVEYEVTFWEGMEYYWKVESGYILDTLSNKALIEFWDQGRNGVVSVTVRDTLTGCVYDAVHHMVILPGMAPGARKEIEAKKDENNKVYLLVYPESGFYYQWYKNGEKITGATKQYYYSGEGIDKNSEYTVYVSSDPEYLCGNLSEPYLFSEQPKRHTVKITPNPSGGSFHLNLDGENAGSVPATVSVFAIDGRLMHMQRFESGGMPVHAALPQGFYILKIVTDAGEEYSEKLIIQ